MCFGEVIMNILVGHAGFYPHSGGGDKYVENIGRILADRGHKVTIFCVNIPKYKYSYIYKGMHVKRFDPIIASEVEPLVNTFKEKINNFDIVHLHNIQQLMIQTLFLRAKIHNIPTIITVHSDPIKDSYIGNLIKKMRWLIQCKWIFNSADRVIVLTKYYEELFKLKGIKRSMEVIPNGIDLKQFKERKIDLSRFNLPENKKIAFFIGRFTKQKGINYLLEAIPLVKSKDIAFALAGTGVLKEKMELLSKKLHIEEKVIFLGQISDEEKIGLYHKSDFIIIPSIFEGFPTVLLEAMACKKPVIITKINGIDKFVKNYNCGIIIPPRDNFEIANSIDKMMNLNLKELGENGYNHVINYDWNKIALDIEEVYNKAIIGKNKKR
jgi:glycosyltransferase involved in cell wall biosynthesis